jgi:RNA polymerase sigma factor (sigma-70 family)
METPTKGSVSCWLDELKAGREVAAQELWNRYFGQLVEFARRRLHGLRRDADEEDIALSALKSAMIGVQNNRFPDLSDRTGLWPLLVTITARKAANEIKRQCAKRRSRTSEQPLIEASTIIGAEASPDFAARFAEAIDNLVRGLGDSMLQVIAREKLEGFTNEEVAHRLGVSERTVVRKLARIRQEWTEG